jgi:hypothetical protein
MVPVMAWVMHHMVNRAMDHAVVAVMAMVNRSRRSGWDCHAEGSDADKNAEVACHVFQDG